MPAPLAPHLEPELEPALTLGLDTPLAPDTQRLAAFLARAFGPGTLALIHYGSHAQQSGAAPESAHDFFVIVEDYGAAYRSLCGVAPAHFSPGVATVLNRMLPPNVLAVRESGLPHPLTAKCAILSGADLAAACSNRARDLFVQARLFQQVQIAWSRDREAHERVSDSVRSVRARTFEWGGPFLPETFDALEYCRALLVTAFAAEVRPESDERVDALVHSQREVLIQIYDALLNELEAGGRLVRDGERFRLAHAPRTAERVRVRLWLAMSKTRATLRWAKYVALYDSWLEYAVRKVERRRGVSLELKPHERRWPLLFLWPKAIRILGRRPAPRR